MRALYLPSEHRISSFTEQKLKGSVANNTQTEPTSRLHAFMNALVTEFERAETLTQRHDVRPWTADTRTVHALTQASGDEDEVDLEELLHLPPDSWRKEPRRSYALAPEAIEMLVGEDLPIVSAIETSEGLRFQAGTYIFELYDGNNYPVLVQDGVENGHLVSLSDKNWQLYQTFSPREAELAVTIEGISAVFWGHGFGALHIDYVRSAVLEGDTPIAQLEDFVQGGNLTRISNGENVGYSVQNGEVLTDVQARMQLFYNARRTIDVTPLPLSEGEAHELPQYQRLSLAPLLEDAVTMPDASDMTFVNTLDPLLEVSGQTKRHVVDRQGLVGRAYVGHEIKTALPTRWHTVVAGDHTVTLTEQDSHRLLFQTGFDETIAGLTWTRDLELGVVLRTPTSLDVVALVDEHSTRIGGYRPIN